MNNTIDFNTAKTIDTMSKKIDHIDDTVSGFFSFMHMVMQNELGNAEPYFAAVSPVLDLTVIRPDDAPHILPCFDEADEGIGISEDEPLGFRYNPKQVIKLMGKRYLIGPVIFHRFDDDGGTAMKNMNCVSTMPEIMPEITDEAIIEALFAQRPYEEKVINSAFLEIPAEYQRKLNIPNVEKMSAEFTELIANPPKVSYRDGHYFVFDGQHTIVTRRAMNGGQDLPIICKVYEGLTEEEEAMLFSRQTGVSTPLTAGAELRAALVGKDPESLAFVKATESTGLQLGLDSYRAPWKIICIRTAFKEYKAYGADLYKEALTMLAKGWEGDPDSLRSGILQGMVRFVALYQGEYDPDRLVKRLHTVHPMTLVNDEKSLSGTVSYKYMMLILRTYNGASRRFNLPIKQ